MKSDLFGETAAPRFSAVQEPEPDSTRAAHDEAFVEKYKNKTSIGSEDLSRGGGGAKKDLSQFEGRTAIGSDDVFGKSKPEQDSSRRG